MGENYSHSSPDGECATAAADKGIVHQNVIIGMVDYCEEKLE